MGPLVYIFAANPDYGRYLQSLICQVSGDVQVVLKPPQSRRTMKRLSAPGLVIVELDGRRRSSNVMDCSNFSCPCILVTEKVVRSENSQKCKETEVFVKPIEPWRFAHTVAEMLDRNNGAAERIVCLNEPFLVGISDSIREIRSKLERISRTDLAVLITGETGTGKGLVAMAIHNNSSRRAHPFVPVNCSSIPVSLFESELFGYRKGAFTGATADKPGKFDLAEKGTIFLDEISEVPVGIQAKLLHVLQEGEYSPIGAVTNSKVDVRVISATNADLEDLVARKQFRGDLYFRLKVILVALPPLRERPEDIQVLREHFANKYSTTYGQKPMKFSKEFCELMEIYDWPGNVRELENLVKMAVALGSEEMALDELRSKVEARGIRKKHQKENVLRLPMEEIRRRSLREIAGHVAVMAERKAIVEALQETGGNKKAAADLLQVSYKSLLTKIKAFGL